MTKYIKTVMKKEPVNAKSHKVVRAKNNKE